MHGALPILGGDKVAGSLYFADRHRDGFYDVNTGQGPRTNDASDNEDFYTLRGQLLFRPNSNLTARIIGDYTHRDENCCAAVVKEQSLSRSTRASAVNAQSIVAGLAGAGGGEAQTPNPYNRLAYQNQPACRTSSTRALSETDRLQAAQHQRASITSITAFRNWKLTDGNDLDFSNADILQCCPTGDANSTQFQDFSQELRFAGTYGKLDYLVGGFYANEYLRDNFELLERQPVRHLSERPVQHHRPQARRTPASCRSTFGPNAVFPGGDGGMDRYRQRDDDYSDLHQRHLPFHQQVRRQRRRPLHHRQQGAEQQQPEHRQRRRLPGGGLPARW